MDEVVIIAGFPITPDVVLKKLGTHLDIPFEVTNHWRDQPESLRGKQGTWCYYVTVTEQMVDAETFEKFWLAPGEEFWPGRGPSYNYTSAPFADVYWHGGITYYEKKGGLDGDARAVTMGCDFAHIWDDGQLFDYAKVEREAKRTIDELLEKFSFRRRCSWSGKWGPESEMVEHTYPNGRVALISKERAAELALEQP